MKQQFYSWVLIATILNTVLLVAGCEGRANSSSTDALDDASAAASVEASSTFEASTPPEASTSVDTSATIDAGISQTKASFDASASSVDAPALAPTSDAASSDAAQCTSDAGTGAACQPGPAPCSPTTCPTGCCDSDGVCQPGTAESQCGAGGTTCEACFERGSGMPGGGFSLAPTCTNQQCVNPTPCQCTSGCCDANGACQPGTSDTQCGQQTTCADCTASGLQCLGRTCLTPYDGGGACTARTCPSGCCDFATGNCEQGLTNMACGNFGAFCQSCADKGQSCSSQQCMPPEGGPACNEFNCVGCCDTNGNCSVSGSDTQCGGQGRLCVDCVKLGDVCMSGSCFAPDGGQPCSQTCQNGCCDATGLCQPGFLDTQCGGQGVTCQDCTSLKPASTCDVNATVCTSERTCPAAYLDCPAALVLSAPIVQHVCSTDELENAAAACAGGATTSACNEFQFADGLAFGRQCSDCLRPFLQDFVTQVGIRTCVAPYVDASCNHNSACIADCVTESCYHCEQACDTQALSGTCATFLQADACVTESLSGPGALCNPATYQGNFGAWLQAVGAEYCGQ